MEAIFRDVKRNGRLIAALGVLLILGIGFVTIMGLDAQAKKQLLWTVQDYLPIIMFMTLAVLLFSGFPVAFILGGLALLFGLLGYFADMFAIIEFFNFLPRIWGQAAENLVLVSVPAFVFMGVMMERSGVASDLLYCVQVLLKKVPGDRLALAVTIMGTVLAAMTGIIGASVTMMTALALPTMMRQGYSHASVLRGDCRIRYAWHPDSAEHHADYHGRPAGGVRRQCVHGGNCAWALSGASFILSLSLVIRQSSRKSAAPKLTARIS